MKRVLVPLAEGFEEIEAITIIDVFRRAGVTVDVAAVSDDPVRGSHGIAVGTDIPLSKATADDYDLIALPGGMPGTLNLRNSRALAALLKELDRQEKYLTAICAAPIVLASCQLLEGKEVTSHPSVREQLEGVTYREEAVVKDGRIVTSRGPGTALAFALALVETVVGHERAADLRRAMLVEPR